MGATVRTKVRSVRVGWRLVLATVGLVLVLCPSVAGAEQPQSDPAQDRVTAMEVSYVVLADGTVGVKETIDVDSGETKRTGFVRFVDVVRPAPDGSFRSVSVVQPSTTRDGVDIPVQQSGADGSVRLAAVSPDTEVSGTHRYTFLYSIDGAIDTDTSGERRVAAMPVNGNRMPPIERLQIKLAGPVEAIGCDPEQPCEPYGPQAPPFVAEGIAGGAPVTFRFEAALDAVAERNGDEANDPSPNAPIQVVPNAVTEVSKPRSAAAKYAVGGIALGLVVAALIWPLVRRRRSAQPPG